MEKTRYDMRRGFPEINRKQMEVRWKKKTKKNNKKKKKNRRGLKRTSRQVCEGN